ncbi:hypothetical protein SAMN05421854_104360 [Amycolatopsis rubida]|uniref:Uncharacterized protein n=1 Tax=Amycolatopsis rubida TaxID=112413 RepID=A0A1I5NFI3_9PSEU|nr:hypothetical protein SAMN05421854_104360 [Amycolatopsis rubida]
MLGPNGIPSALFASSAVVQFVAARTGGEAAAELARDGLGCLHRLNLITRDLRQGIVRMHAMVQRATCDALPSGRCRDLARTAADALLQI